MQIVINSYGSYIRKRGECFEIKIDDRKMEVSSSKIQSILISTSAMISTDAIQLAHENNVDIVFLDKYGNPFSRVWHSKFGSTNYIRRKQLEYSDNIIGLDLVIEWIAKKIENQEELLEKLLRTRKENEVLGEYIEKISRAKKEITNLKGNNIEEIRNNIFAIEGKAGRVYFQAINNVLPKKFQFTARSRNPAKDEFNAILNYGYGVLYSKVERACIVSGLDPYIGFLHTDNYGKKSFVFDIIELFRHFVDEVVVKLFSKRMVKQTMFKEIPNGILLDKEGKQLLLGKLNENFEDTVRYRGRNIKKKNIMEFECHRIANSFIKEK